MRTINGIAVMEQADIQRIAPSFYATAPKNTVSDKYSFINSRDVAVALWDQGWMPTSIREARSRDLSNVGYTKHIIRWSHKDMVMSGGDRIELVGVNSHNRASAFEFFAGIFRMVCTNGLISRTADFGSFKVKHMGADLQAEVLKAVSMVSEQAGKVAATVADWKAIDLTPDERGVFAVAAQKLVYDDPSTAPVAAHRLLTPRRWSDARSDLWTVYNVVQENVLKGGLRGYNAQAHRRVTTRQINSIDKDVKLNSALWTLAAEVAKLKTA